MCQGAGEGPDGMCCCGKSAVVSQSVEEPRGKISFSTGYTVYNIHIVQSPRNKLIFLSRGTTSIRILPVPKGGGGHNKDPVGDFWEVFGRSEPVVHVKQ